MREAFERFMRAVDMEQYNEMKNSDWGKETSYINILHLFVIGHSERTTVSELADKLGLSRPAVTQKVNELEELGLIKKVQSTQDKRFFYISLSNRVKQSSQSTKTDSVLDAVEKEFSKDKKVVFAEILNFMAAYVNGVEESI
ncbi:MarR family transcriptional regulator [Clostridioides mangenotii]|uniref:MarR family winged helix-turn-helix transcriptional regulator n=1 Tax=Metaclostridioides mangenotii TaxID=1540 RepID=UPI001C105457|nr:MarR family transcriptional regulator [Clostridioides mangenotii]